MNDDLRKQWEKVTKMRAENNRITDRSSRKYAHPEIRRYFTDGSYLPEGTTLYETTYGLVHDPDYPEEKKQQIYDAICRDYPHPLAPGHADSQPEHGEWNSFFVSGCPEEPDAPPLNLIVRSPKVRTSSRLPALYYIGGGGHFTNYCDLNEIELLCKELNCVIIIPLIRIGRDQPYPAAINDTHAGYQRVYTHANELGINEDNITIYGLSAGGGIGLSLCFRLKRYGFSPRGIVATVPPVDDRLIYESSKVFSGQFDGYFWGTMFKLYLGKNYGSPYLGPEAAVNRATIEECRGLPPVFIHTAELDTDRDACMQFAQKVAAAGSFTEIHCWGGSDHMGLLFSQNSPYSARFNAVVRANIHDCMTYDLRRPWLLNQE